MQLNFLITALAALVPLVMGFIWYNPKVLGNTWMRESGLTQERAREANMPLIMFLGYVFAFMVALALNFAVIHQYHVYSILIAEPGFGDPNSAVGKLVTDFMAKYGQNYRTFKHGALHGTMTGVLMISPIIANSALFERRSFKYIAINAGYWIINLAIMGGVISAFA